MVVVLSKVALKAFKYGLKRGIKLGSDIKLKGQQKRRTKAELVKKILHSNLSEKLKERELNKLGVKYKAKK